jgi:hypothetical protein
LKRIALAKLESAPLGSETLNPFPFKL